MANNFRKWAERRSTEALERFVENNHKRIAIATRERFDGNLPLTKTVNSIFSRKLRAALHILEVRRESADS